MKVQGIVALAVVAVAIAACGGGGGGGGGSAPPGSNAVLPTAGPNATPTPGNVLPAGYVVDSVSISMPKGTYSTTSVRRAQTVGTGTESIVFTLLQQNGQAATGTPQVFGLIATSLGCTVNPNTQALSCVLPVGAPIGQDVFLAQTYDNSNGTGNLTGSGAVALSVGQNTTNTASIVLNAQVANVYVVAGGTVLGAANLSSVARNRGTLTTRKGVATLGGLVTSMPVFVIATDSSGNTILNPSAYNAPIYLQLEFDPTLGENALFNTTADVTLSVTYGPSDPSPCTANGTLNASTFYASLPLCSPGDNVTAALSATGGTNPSVTAYVFGYTSATSLVPVQAPAPVVTPSNNSFTYFSVGYPTPSPSPSGGTIQVTPQ